MKPEKNRKGSRRKPDFEGRSSKVSDLLALLSRPGALVVLGKAEEGITAQTDEHLKVGLTRKQYYARMSQLVRAGLVEKTGNAYRLTKFGALVWHDYIPKLETAFMSCGMKNL